MRRAAHSLQQRVTRCATQRRRTRARSDVWTQASATQRGQGAAASCKGGAGAPRLVLPWRRPQYEKRARLAWVSNNVPDLASASYCGCKVLLGQVQHRMPEKTASVVQYTDKNSSIQVQFVFVAARCERPRAGRSGRRSMPLKCAWCEERGRCSVVRAAVRATVRANVRATGDGREAKR